MASVPTDGVTCDSFHPKNESADNRKYDVTGRQRKTTTVTKLGTRHVVFVVQIQEAGATVDT